MNVLLSFATLGGGRADRARPKSHSWQGVNGDTHGRVRTHLEIAVGVEQQVGWFQIAVQHVGRVQCLERSECLCARQTARFRMPSHSPGR